MQELSLSCLAGLVSLFSTTKPAVSILYPAVLHSGELLHWSIDLANKVKWQRTLVALSVVVNLRLKLFRPSCFVADFIYDLTRVDRLQRHLQLWTNRRWGNFIFEKILLPVRIMLPSRRSAMVWTFTTVTSSPLRTFWFSILRDFFPQLVAGPVSVPLNLSRSCTAVQGDQRASRSGHLLDINGLLKKLFLADYLAVQFIDRVFDSFDGFDTQYPLWVFDAGLCRFLGLPV